MRCGDCLALYPQFLQHCQAINDRWTATAAQMEAATLYVQLGAWDKAREIIEQAAPMADDLSALLLKLRLQLLQARVALAAGETLEGADHDRILALAQELGVDSLMAESWLLSGLIQQREGWPVEAVAALSQSRNFAQGEASRRLLPEIVGAQAELFLVLGKSERALACVEELVGGNPPLLIEQALDPSSLYMTCYMVLDAVNEPWAEQMLVRGRRLLSEHAGLIAEDELRRAFCENIAHHRSLLTVALTGTLP
jgi:tetratricopeptide (TPR) repeat protein